MWFIINITLITASVCAAILITLWSLTKSYLISKWLVNKFSKKSFKMDREFNVLAITLILALPIALFAVVLFSVVLQGFIWFLR